MAYADEVLADSPWGYWRLQETTGAYLDSSPNARDMAVSGTFTRGVVGPVPGGKAAQFSATNAANWATTSAAAEHSAATVEAWVYLPAEPASGSLVYILGKTGGDKFLYVNPDRSVTFRIFTTTTVLVTTPAAALALNTWHHVVASVGAAGSKVRVDKTTLATNAATTSAAGAHTVRVREVSGPPGAVIIAEPAWYTTQLSDARTDAHYDAAVSTPAGVTVLGAASNIAVAGHVGAPITPVRVAGSLANVAVTALVGAPVVGGGAVNVAGSAAAVAVTAHVGTPAALAVVETSTRYANDGYGYDGTAAVYFEPPIAEPPAHIRRVKVQQVHQSMSAPNLVNGVPR